MNAPVGRSLAPLRLPVNNEVVRVAPADFMKLRRPKVLWVMSIWLGCTGRRNRRSGPGGNERSANAAQSVIPAKRSASRNPACSPGADLLFHAKILWIPAFAGMTAGLKSANDRLHRAGGLDARETLIEALILVSEPLVIDTEQVKHRGLEVADMDGVLDDVVGELVSLTMHNTPFESRRPPSRS